MNKFVKALKSLDYNAVKQLISDDPKWLQWAEKDGKNALHLISAVEVSKSPKKADSTLKLTKLLVKNGMDMNSIHRIPEKNGHFPATPLWYAYTRGRNKKLYTYLLKQGVDPSHCMYAIAWNDEVRAADLFKKYGAKIDNGPFQAAVYWRRFKMMEWFLKNGADVNFIGSEGYSALLLLVKRKDPIDQIKVLMKYGADIHLKHKNGLTPLKLARGKLRESLLQLFEAKSR
jgi:hypothetical protein